MKLYSYKHKESSVLTMEGYEENENEDDVNQEVVGPGVTYRIHPDEEDRYNTKVEKRRKQDHK